jgi:hypothetical protein
VYYFFPVVVVIRYETTATACWASPFIVRAFFNDTITVAVWAGFHVRLVRMLPHRRDYIRWPYHIGALIITGSVADPLNAMVSEGLG